MLARSGWSCGPRREVQGRTPTMNERRKSDSPAVLMKSPNNAGQPAAEEMKGTGAAKGNLRQQNAPPDSAPARRVQCAGAGTSGSSQG